MRNTLLEGQTAEVAMVGPDSVFGASAGLADDVPLTDAVVRLPGIASIAGFRTAADRSATFPNAAGAASTGAVRASPAIRRVQCVAFGRSVAIGLAVACARSNRQRKPAADAGSPGADDRCAALRSIDRRPRAAAARNSSLQPRSHRNHRCGRGCERRPANATRQSRRNRTCCSRRPIDNSVTDRGSRGPHDNAHVSEPGAGRCGRLPILLANPARAAYVQSVTVHMRRRP